MILHDVLRSYGEAWQRWLPYLTAHLFVRLVVTALMVPLIGLALTATLSFSDQTALTDQDIARFLVTPAGLVGAAVILTLLLVALILDIVVATAILRQGSGGPARALSLAVGFVFHSVPRLVPFVARFLLRLLVIVAPFLAVAGGIFLLVLTEFDINYYLSQRPPEFLAAAGAIGLVLLVLAWVLVQRLSAWAIAMHLTLWEGLGARQAFDESAGHMTGHQVGLVLRVALWFGLRLLATAIAGGFAALIVSIVAPDDTANLSALATAALVGSGIYVALTALVNAVSNGALAGLLNDQFTRALAGDAPEIDVTTIGIAGLARPRLAWILIGAGVFSVLSLGSGGVLAERLQAEAEAEIIAHRGAAALAPENTLASVAQAVADGADWIEIDVQESAEGDVIVAHDSDFMKSAGVATKVWDVTAAELAGIDVGSWFGPQFSAERVPLLSEVLDAVRDQARLLIELKYYGHDEDLEARVAAAVEAADMVDQIATMSLKYPAVQKMRALRPDWRAGVLAATSIGDLSGLDGDFLALNQARITPLVVRNAEAAGKEVYAWTVNDPVSIARMLWVGVDGLITDDPALARRVVSTYNELSVAERLILALSDRVSLTLTPEDPEEIARP